MLVLEKTSFVSMVLEFFLTKENSTWRTMVEKEGGTRFRLEELEKGGNNSLEKASLADLCSRPTQHCRTKRRHCSGDRLAQNQSKTHYKF